MSGNDLKIDGEEKAALLPATGLGTLNANPDKSLQSIQQAQAFMGIAASATMMGVFSVFWLNVLKVTALTMFKSIAFPFLAASDLTQTILAWRTARIKKDRDSKINAGIETVAVAAVNMTVISSVAAMYGAATVASAAIAAFAPEIFLIIIGGKTLWTGYNAYKARSVASAKYMALKDYSEIRGGIHEAYEKAVEIKNDSALDMSQQDKKIQETYLGKFSFENRTTYENIRRRYEESRVAARNKTIEVVCGVLSVIGIALVMAFAAPLTFAIRGIGAVGAIIGGLVGCAMTIGGLIHGWWKSKKDAEKAKEASAVSPAAADVPVAAPVSTPAPARTSTAGMAATFAANTAAAADTSATMVPVVATPPVVLPASSALPSLSAVGGESSRRITPHDDPAVTQTAGSTGDAPARKVG